MNSQAGSERRKYLRVAPDREYPVRVDINGSNFIDILQALDISQGGVGVRVNHGFNGCDLEGAVSFVIEIPVPKHALLRGSGRIKHISGNRFGIIFDTLPDSVVSQIREYIAFRIKQDSWWAWFKYKLGLLQ
jgi:hypothetical protein